MAAHSHTKYFLAPNVSYHGIHPFSFCITVMEALLSLLWKITLSLLKKENLDMHMGCLLLLHRSLYIESHPRSCNVFK